MADIQKSILRLSDGMSEMIGTGTIKTMDTLEKGYVGASEKKEELREKLNENKAELRSTIDEHREEYLSRKEELEKRLEHLKKELIYRKIFGIRRLLRAFPGIKHHTYQEMINYLQDMIK